MADEKSIETEIIELKRRLYELERDSSEKRYNRLFQENTLFSNRLSLFFVAESMLFISFVTSFNAVTAASFFRNVICVLGFAISFAFAALFFNHIKYIDKLKKSLDEHKEDYPKDYNDIIGKSIPIVIAFVWIMFLFIY